MTTLKFQRVRNNFSWPFRFLFLILASSLTSCYNEPGFLGNNLLPDDDIFQVRVDSTFKVSASTLTKDSLNTLNSSSGLVGYINNEIFGSTKASIICRYLPVESTEGYGGSTATADSIFFYFTPSGFYGDTTTELNLHIHEITDTSILWGYPNALSPIDNNLYNPTPLISTTLNGNGQLKLSLPLTFGQSLMDSLALTDSKLFYSKYKGFYITVDDVAGFGGVTYNISYSNMYLKLYYHYNKEVDGKDSTFTSSKIFSLNRWYFQYLHDPSKADPAKKIQHLNDTITEDTLFYIQNFGGVYGKIKFPDLEQWRDSMPMVVHRAELLIGNENSISATDSLINQLLFYYRDNNEWNGVIVDQQSSSGINTNGSYQNHTNSYKVDITYHFQKLLKGEYSDNSLYVFPYSSTNIKYGLLKTSNSSTPIKLIITYSKLK
ncbi:DUF4270 family protein [Tenuifilum thalassicum]|uniref:DUF4270 domain-containing protein n=1 Tax=Tenuifilum thalassicum TaxID=2590900 RepID=A0A7D4B9L8_9BACT|nr:DUF4270 family protein [Tenuifilum thalassicum]QKG78760.1 DUF4270 domain-containing protein [Tenuifilum thalassicum]